MHLSTNYLGSCFAQYCLADVAAGCFADLSDSATCLGNSIAVAFSVSSDYCSLFELTSLHTGWCNVVNDCSDVGSFSCMNSINFGILPRRHIDYSCCLLSSCPHCNCLAHSPRPHRSCSDYYSRDCLSCWNRICIDSGCSCFHSNLRSWIDASFAAGDLS